MKWKYFLRINIYERFINILEYRVSQNKRVVQFLNYDDKWEKSSNTYKQHVEMTNIVKCVTVFVPLVGLPTFRR